MASAITIQPLTEIGPADLQRLITGYTSPAKYAVRRSRTLTGLTLALELEVLPEPYHKHYPPPDAATLEHYGRLPKLGFSFAAYTGPECIGLALAEPHTWNQSLLLHELHVAGGYQRQGLGRRLVEAVATQGRAAGLRILSCETQNTNVPALSFYQALGFELEGLDLSLYSNADFPDGEMALFMKRRLE